MKYDIYFYLLLTYYLLNTFFYTYLNAFITIRKVILSFALGLTTKPYLQINNYHGADTSNNNKDSFISN